jgi:phospholipase/carboxylesterase
MPALLHQSELGTYSWRIISFHGLGSDASELHQLLNEIRLPLQKVSLQAPYPYASGFAWFPIQWTDDGIRFEAEDVRKCREMIRETLMSLPEVQNTILLGFSQGGMVALDYAQFENSCSAVALLSSRCVQHGGSLENKRVLMQHGRFDEVIPIRDARLCREELEKMGANVTFLEYPIGHAVSQQSINDLQHWIESLMVSVV